MNLVREFAKELKHEKMENVPLIVGDIILENDIPKQTELGVNLCPKTLQYEQLYVRYN